MSAGRGKDSDHMVRFEDGHVEHVSSATESEAEPSIVPAWLRRRTSRAPRVTERAGHARGSGSDEEGESETESASEIESAYDSQDSYDSRRQNGGDSEEETADSDSGEESGYSSEDESGYSSEDESGYSSRDKSGGDSEDRECEVSAILVLRPNSKEARNEYLIKRKGYGDKLPTWVPDAAKSHAHTTHSKTVAKDAEKDEQHSSESLESVGSDAAHTSDEDSDRAHRSDGIGSDQEDRKSLENTPASRNEQSSSTGTKVKSTASVNKDTKLHHSKKVTFLESDSPSLSQQRDPLRNQRIPPEPPETRKRKERRLRYVKSQAPTKTYTVRFKASSDSDQSLFSGAFVRVPSSGVGLLCGADAVYNLLKSQLRDITKASVVSAIRGLVADYREFQISSKEKGDSDLQSPANRNFYYDQLAAGLAHFGNYVLGVVVIRHRRDGAHEVFLEDQRTEKKGKGEVKWVIWERQHWEALVPAANATKERRSRGEVAFRLSEADS